MQTVLDKSIFEASFNISGLPFGDKIKELLNLINATAYKCRPKLMPISTGPQWPLFLILSISVFSCFLDVYACRLKPQICSFLHGERAIERASYLHKKIIAGRAERKANLGSMSHFESTLKVKHLKTTIAMQEPRI